MLVSSISVGRKRKALSEVKSEAPVLEVSLLAAVDASCAVLGGGDGAFIDGTTKATVLPEERLSRSAGKTRGKTLMVAVATCIHSKKILVPALSPARHRHLKFLAL